MTREARGVVKDSLEMLFAAILFQSLRKEITTMSEVPSFRKPQVDLRPHKVRVLRQISQLESFLWFKLEQLGKKGGVCCEYASNIS
jgi:hypothetical protein